MRKFLVAFYNFLASPWTHIVVGCIALVFAWCFAYEINYNIDLCSFAIGVVSSVGFGCVDLGFQKLVLRRCDK